MYGDGLSETTWQLILALLLLALTLYTRQKGSRLGQQVVEHIQSALAEPTSKFTEAAVSVQQVSTLIAGFNQTSQLLYQAQAAIITEQRQSLIDLRQTNADQNSVIASYKIELDKLRSQYSDTIRGLEDQNRTLTVELNKAKEELATLTAQQAHMQATINDLTEKVASMQDALNGTQSELERTREDLKEAQRKLTETQTKLAQAEGRIKELERLQREAVVEKEQTEQEKKRLEVDLRAERVKVTELQQQVEAQKLQIATLQKQVDDLNEQKK